MKFKTPSATHALRHRLADVHFAGFAPANRYILSGLCNRIDIIYFDEIAKLESLTENIKNLELHQV